jgi:hypothetical protein
LNLPYSPVDVLIDRYDENPIHDKNGIFLMKNKNFNLEEEEGREGEGRGKQMNFDQHQFSSGQ